MVRIRKSHPRGSTPRTARPAVARLGNQGSAFDRTPRATNINGRIPLADTSPRLLSPLERAPDAVLRHNASRLAHSTAKMFFFQTHSRELTFCRFFLRKNPAFMRLLFVFCRPSCHLPTRRHRGRPKALTVLVLSQDLLALFDVLPRSATHGVFPRKNGSSDIPLSHAPAIESPVPSPAGARRRPLFRCLIASWHSASIHSRLAPGVPASPMISTRIFTPPR